MNALPFLLWLALAQPEEQPVLAGVVAAQQGQAQAAAPGVPPATAAAAAPAETAPPQAATAQPTQPPAAQQQPELQPAPAQAAQAQAPAVPRAPRLNDAAVAPDGPLREPDINYQNRVLSNFQATQSRQGPFDGRWTVSGSSGDMFVLQLTDPGDGGQIEGAWRDVRRAGQGRSGLIDSISREGEMVTVRFVEAGNSQPVEVRLRSPQPGGWLGEATTTEGGRQSVVMHRAQGVETAAAAAPYVAQPPPRRYSEAPARRSPKSAKAKKGRQGTAQRHGRATAKSRSPTKRHSASKSSSKAKKSAVKPSSSKKSTAKKPASSTTKKSTSTKKPTAKKKT
jgi:hypothetical protein